MNARSVAIVTGGSAGLGFHLSKALAAKSYDVVMIGRDQHRLDQAQAALVAAGTDASQLRPIAADVTQAADVERLFVDTAERFGRLDLLINCAGRSMRGLASQTSMDDFRDLLELNALAAIRCCQRAVPAIRKTGGTIINVGSLAGRIATPKLGAYPVSKFALTAYSEQLRRELKVEGVHVMTVFPGPIARADAGDRYAEQATGLGEGAGRPGGSRLSTIDPHVLAKKILRAADRKRPELIPFKARMFCLLATCSPRLGDWIAARMTA